MGTLIYVVEIYPADGYATLAIGTVDLTSGVIDGINEKGLYAALLQDGDTYNDPISDLAGVTSTRLNFMQLLRSILEHCATVEEAKQKISETQISMPFMGQHFFICDDSGDAVIAEYDNVTKQAVFTDYKDIHVTLNDYAVYLHPDITAFVPENPDDPHDDYLRSAKLHHYISVHKGAFTADNAWKAMKEVEANSDGSSEGVLSGADDTVRLLWTVVTDLTDRSMAVKFFLKDGPVINETYNAHELVLSEPFTFRLER
jgi:hypothetical protein